MPLSTNEDLVFKIELLRTDLRLCNADKKALRDWKKDASK
jgi:hypothetical protein